jgi:hypothetical protein
VAGIVAAGPVRGLNDAAAGAGAPAHADMLARDAAATIGEGQVKAGEKDVAALRTRVSRENTGQAQSPPAAMLQQPQDEVISFAPLRPVGTRVIPMEEAVQVLGGSIRLIDSLPPVRVEIMGADSTIRVAYQTAGVEIWLDQRRDRGPAEAGRSLPQAGTAKLGSGFNQLSWNDLQGFYLTLTGPLPTSKLEQIKARIH